MNWKPAQIPRWVFNVIAALAGLGLLVVLAFSLNALFASRTEQAQTVGQPPHPASQKLSPTPTLVANQTEKQTQLPESVGRIAFIRKGSLWLAVNQLNATYQIQAVDSPVGKIDQVSFSPDSEWLLFHYNYNIWIASVHDLRLYQLSDQGQIYDGWIADAHSAIWFPDSKLVAYLVEVSSDKQVKEPIPQVNTGLWLVSVDRSEHRHITDDISGVFSFTPKGSGLVYKRHSTGESALIDLDSLQIQILNPSFVSGQYTFSKDGTRMAYFDKVGNNYTIAIADQDGKKNQVVVESPFVVQFPSFSSDGQYLSFIKQTSQDPTRQELWIIDLFTKKPRLISASALDSHWGSDSKTLVFWRRTSANFNAGDLFLFDLESGIETPLTFTGDVFPRFAVSR